MISRRAGRVLLLDNRDRVLLLQGLDPTRTDPPWWFTPGGGAEAGEDCRQAARRELREETGLDFEDLIGPIWFRTAHFEFYNEQYEQYEEFFLARIDEHTVSDAAWTELERKTVLAHRWWTLGELAETAEMVFPLELAPALARLLDEGFSDQPIEIH